MLYHRQCKSEVKLYLSSIIVILSNFGITRNGIRPTLADIETPSDPKEPKFWCVSCRTEVPIGDICTVCFNCGSEISVADTKVPQSNGTYCQNCSQMFREKNQSLRNLTTILSKVTFQRG